MTFVRPKMDILPINNLNPVVESTLHEDRQHEKRRKPAQKQETIAPVPVYTPDGRLEEKPVSKIDIVG